MKRKLLCIACAIYNVVVYAQVGIGTSTPNPGAILHLQSLGARQALILPFITLENDIKNPTEGMIVYSLNEQGIRGYQHRNYLNPKWTGIFLTGDALQIKTDITTSANYSRAVVNTNTEYEIPGMEKTIYPTVNSSYISAEYKTTVRFYQNCFRGQIILKAFIGSSTTPVATESTIFNFSGNSNLLQSIPISVSINEVATAGQEVKIKAFQNPTTSNNCSTTGTLANNELIINYY